MTTFLYPVVKNLSLTAARRRYRMINDETVLAEAAAKAAEGTTGTRTELAAVMAGLPEAQRETVLMRFVDGFTLEEIGQVLGIPVGTVKSRLHLALAALRESPRVNQYFRDQG
jgi:RNA polymerase sigma-70 factor (ECF subfamily)